MQNVALQQGGSFSDTALRTGVARGVQREGDGQRARPPPVRGLAPLAPK